jgi:hypothetical protein
MEDLLFWSRLQFAFTISYHYLFPQLTMGLAWIIVYFKWQDLRCGDERFGNAARFWTRIFAINFAVGVVTGIPMEFQFGTNWAGFSKFAGNVIGQRLAMEGMFAFFLESAMVGAMVWGRKTAWTAQSLSRNNRSGGGELAFCVFHPDHQRFHATPGRSRSRAGWLAAAPEHYWLSLESMGSGDVPAQPMCGTRDGGHLWWRQ